MGKSRERVPPGEVLTRLKSSRGAPDSLLVTSFGRDSLFGTIRTCTQTKPYAAHSHLTKTNATPYRIIGLNQRSILAYAAVDRYGSSTAYWQISFTNESSLSRARDKCSLLQSGLH